MARRPSESFHDGGRPAKRAQPAAFRRIVPASRCGRAAGRSGACAVAHAYAPCVAWRGKLESPARSMDSPDSELLSINTATVRAQWKLPEIIAGCARRGIRKIAPWRDQVAATGLKESAQRVRDAGLTLSGYCRGGMFPALDGKGRKAALDDNKRAIDEALTLAAPCLLL